MAAQLAARVQVQVLKAVVALTLAVPLVVAPSLEPRVRPQVAEPSVPPSEEQPSELLQAAPWLEAAVALEPGAMVAVKVPAAALWRARHPVQDPPRAAVRRELVLAPLQAPLLGRPH